jgi:hypothetical protein
MKRKAFKILYTKESAESVDIDVCKKFIFNLARKAQRLNALNTLAQIIERNEDSHESVIKILEGLHGEEREDSEIVGSLLSDLSRSFDSSIKFGSGISAIRNNIEGFARGNLIIVFGRPEVGKSSYTAITMSGHDVDNKVFNYFEMDKEMEKIYPINPLKESRITDDEIKKRKARFYDYEKIWNWKKEQLTRSNNDTTRSNTRDK